MVELFCFHLKSTPKMIHLNTKKLIIIHFSGRYFRNLHDFSHCTNWNLKERKETDKVSKNNIFIFADDC